MTTTHPSPSAPPAEETRTGGRLSLRGVHKRFGEHTAIRRLDLEVRSGEFLSLLGPSGCGKTTLLRMIAGFEHPTEGAVELDGTDLTGLPPFRRPVNTVFQSYALFPHLSVAENIAYGLKRAKVPRREIGPMVADALEMVRMRPFADRRPAMLSGGQQQRVALARALVNRPRVLLLDEPMSALDRKLREEMQLELIRLHTDLDLTFIFVTHDQEEALSMSDRTVVMSDGEIQQVGAPEEVYQTPANSFVAGFIGRQNFIAATVADVAAATLRSAHGELAARPGALDGRSPGAAVRAAIRPESVSVEPAAEPAATTPRPGPNTAEGQVVGESFLGDVVQYLVRLDDGAEMLARTRFAEAPSIREGDRALLRWTPADVQVFDDE